MPRMDGIEVVGGISSFMGDQTEEDIDHQAESDQTEWEEEEGGASLRWLRRRDRDPHRLVNGEISVVADALRYIGIGTQIVSRIRRRLILGIGVTVGRNRHRLRDHTR